MRINYDRIRSIRHDIFPSRVVSEQSILIY